MKTATVFSTSTSFERASERAGTQPAVSTLAALTDADSPPSRHSALLNGDAVARVFEAIDDNGDGVLTKEEFKKGFVLLTSDSMLAKAERAKVEAAVNDARVEAVKQAALNLAEAQLMDTLYGEARAPLEGPPAHPSLPHLYQFVCARLWPHKFTRIVSSHAGETAGEFPAQYQPVAGRRPNRNKKSRTLRQPPAAPQESLTQSQRARLKPVNKLERKRKSPRLR